MITTEELDQILKELPYAAGGWASETIRKLVEELKNLKEHSPPVSDLVKELRELSSPYIQEWEARKAAFIFEEPVFKNSVETLAFALCKAADALEKLSCEALSPPGPGAALLERLQKAEREVESLNSDIVYAADRWTKAEQQVETLTKERDLFREWSDSHGAEVERLLESNKALTRERDEARAKLAEADRMRASDPRWLYDALRAMTERTEKAEARVKALRDALAWYGTEGFYHMKSFCTAAAVYDAGVPRNIEVKGSPIMHDIGRRARQALAEDDKHE